MRESIYDFLAEQEDQTKKLMLYKIDPMINFSSYFSLRGLSFFTNRRRLMGVQWTTNINFHI